MGLLGQAGSTLEGYWRGGLTPYSPIVKDGVTIGSRPIANAEMLERFAGVSGGGVEGMVHGAPNGGGVNALGVLGTLGSALGLYSGTRDMLDGEKSTTERVLGGGNALTGLLGTVGGVANMANLAPAAAGATGALATIQSFVAGMTSLGGAGIGGMGLAGEVGAASTWVGTAAGGAGAGTAVGAGAAAATGGAVLGSLLGGIGLGMYGDEHMKSNGLLGHRSISDWGADTAVSADEAVTNFIGGEQGSLQRTIGGGLGTAAGLATVAGTSIAGVPLAIASSLHGAGSAIGDAGSAIGSRISSWLN